jgi:transposase-like protein
MDTRARADFGEREFGTAVLGDRRREERLVTVANQILQHPDGTWPQKLSRPADLEAFYRLMNRPEVTHAAVLAPHAAQTLERMQGSSRVLILHDTTELDYTTLKSINLGEIGNGHGRGYLCHNSLAVKPEGDVLGLVNQILFRRRRAPQRDRKRSHIRRKDRSSRLWRSGSEAIPAAPAGALWVDIADRGSDVTEFLAYQLAAGKHFVIRAKTNRKVVLPGKSPESGKLVEVVRRLPEWGRRPLQIARSAGRPARGTQVAVASVLLQIVPPRQPRGEHGPDLLTVWALRVWELDPPAGVEPLEWILLTNIAVETPEDAWERVDWYKRRWMLEEYHKTLKSGCSIEEMQFTREGSLKPAIALVSVAAVGILWLRCTSRSPEAQTRRARERFPAVMIRVLSKWRWSSQPPHADMTVQEFCLALARLGGHQNRKHDGPPGLMTLWRGWTKLCWMTEGASTDPVERCGKT